MSKITTKPVLNYEKTFVYVLMDSDKSIYYIGISGNIKHRLICHQNRFLGYRAVNLEILAEFYDRGMAEEYEYFLINKFITDGITLENKKIK